MTLDRAWATKHKWPTSQFLAILLFTRNSSGDEIANVNFLYDDVVHVLQNTIDSCINSATDRRDRGRHTQKRNMDSFLPRCMHCMQRVLATRKLSVRLSVKRVIYDKTKESGARAVLTCLGALGPPGWWGPYHPYGPRGGVGRSTL